MEAARARAKEAAEQLVGREREGRVLRERVEGLQFEAGAWGVWGGGEFCRLALALLLGSFWLTIQCTYKPNQTKPKGEARKAVWAKQLELRGCAEELHVVAQESTAQQVREWVL